MTPDELKAIRKRVAPTLSQAEFARALGYRDGDAYRKYESGAREMPPWMPRIFQLLDERGALPNEWLN
jgi:DNA-binding transcriptional regulator YiaG